MIYLLAAIGALTIGVVLWRLLAAGRGIRPDQRPTPPRIRRAPIAPDDDPDFLRSLDEKHKRRDEQQ